MMNHVMLDLETMGNGPSAAIVEIGACLFDPVNGTLGETMTRRVAWEDVTQYGKCDGDTIAWWLIQSSDARTRLLNSERFPAQHCADNFAMFLANAGKVWGKGPSFDCAVLSNFYHEVCGSRQPWSFRDERCVRTVLDLAELSAKDFPPIGVAHSGADDAIAQAVHVIHAYCILGLGIGMTRALLEPLIAQAQLKVDDARVLIDMAEKV